MLKIHHTNPSNHRNPFVAFMRTWTLPVAIVTGTLVYLIFAYVPFLDPIAQVASPIFDTIFPMFMALILFVTFCRVDFHKMRPTRWHLWITVCQLLLVALIVGMIKYCNMQGNSLVMAEGILTCVIGPGAAAAAVVTARLDGNLEQMTTYTFVSNLVTAILVPTIFPLIDRDVNMEFITAFFNILWKVCMVLIVPMAAAYVVKHYMQRLHAWILRYPDLSFYLWGLSLSIVTGTTVKQIVHAGTSASFLILMAAIAAVLCFVQFALGRYVGRIEGAPIEGGQALGQKNTAFAVWIAYTYLDPLSVIGPGCYILWQNAVNSLEIYLKSRDES